MTRPRSARFALTLVLAATGCARSRPRAETPARETSARETSPRDIPPPSGGANCFCPDGGHSYMAQCSPADTDAGCTTYMTPGGPMAPPDLAA